jgi:hypothetical protein
MKNHAHSLFALARFTTSKPFIANMKPSTGLSTDPKPGRLQNASNPPEKAIYFIVQNALL